jgi:uncharacterized protein (TIGR03086 family)
MNDRVGELIEVGLDRDAAALAVRDALVADQDKTEEAGVETGPVQQLDVLIPLFGDVAAAADLDAPTPCEGWAVRDVLAHMNGGARLFTAAFTGEPPTERSIDADPVGTVSEALDGFLDAVQAPGALEKEVQSPFGPMPGEQFARLAALDLLVHLWDVSTAAGRAVAVPDAVVDAADAFARSAITADLRVPGVFGPEVSAPPQASNLETLAAFTGRRP